MWSSSSARLPSWRFAAILLPALVGFGISAYLTAAHYTNAPLACSVTSLIDCSAVTRSAYSELAVASIPIAVLGLAWFAAIGAASLWAMFSPAQRSAMVLFQAALALLGLLYVLYLVYVELVRLHRICEWCTGVHLLTVAIFFLAVSNVQALAGWQEHASFARETGGDARPTETADWRPPGSRT